MRNGLAFWISRTSATSSSVRAMSGLSMGAGVRRSAEESEAGSAVEPPIEGQGLLAPGAAVLLADQIIRKIGPSPAKLFQRAHGEVPILALQERELQQGRENRADLSPAQPVLGAQHPGQLAENGAADVEPVVLALGLLEQMAGRLRLIEIVLGEEADEDVGVNPLHARSRPPLSGSARRLRSGTVPPPRPSPGC